MKLKFAKYFSADEQILCGGCGVQPAPSPDVDTAAVSAKWQGIASTLEGASMWEETFAMLPSGRKDGAGLAAACPTGGIAFVFDGAAPALVHRGAGRSRCRPTIEEKQTAATTTKHQAEQAHGDSPRGRRDGGLAVPCRRRRRRRRWRRV